MLDFFKFVSRMPRIADFSLFFQNFPGEHAPGPPRDICFFFSLAIPGSIVPYVPVRPNRTDLLLVLETLIILRLICKTVEILSVVSSLCILNQYVVS